MNKYVIPICNYPKSKIYNLIINANSYNACKDKIMEKLSDYSECDEYEDFINDLDKQDILIGKITDVEEL